MSDFAHEGGLKGDPPLVDPLRLVWFVVKKRKTHERRRPAVSTSGWMTVRRKILEGYSGKKEKTHCADVQD